jgi:hypothetical protein
MIRETQLSRTLRCSAKRVARLRRFFGRDMMMPIGSSILLLGSMMPVVSGSVIGRFIYSRYPMMWPLFHQRSACTEKGALSGLRSICNNFKNVELAKIKGT